MDDLRLVLVEGETPGRQPCAQTGLDLFGLLPAATDGHVVVGVPHQHRGPGHRLGAAAGAVAVSDPCGLLHPVQRDVQQQGADHPALRSSLLGRRELPCLHHSRLEPCPDRSPCGERAELGQEPVVIDAVERSGQIGVEYPSTLCALTAQRLEDGLDGVVAAAPRPKPIGPRFEARLPLGFQRVLHASLLHAIGRLLVTGAVAASQRPALPPAPHPISGGFDIEASTFAWAHPSGLPLACGPRMERAPLGLSPDASDPAVTSDARQGWGRITNTSPRPAVAYTFDPPISEPTRTVRPRVATRKSKPYPCRSHPVSLLPIWTLEKPRKVGGNGVRSSMALLRHPRKRQESHNSRSLLVTGRADGHDEAGAPPAILVRLA